MKLFYINNPQRRKTISEREKGKQRSPSTQFKPGLVPFNKGIKRPEEWCAKQSQTHLRKIAGVSENVRLAVECVETGNRYGGITEASDATKTSRIVISRCLKGKSKTANKLHWKIVVV